MHVDLEMFYDTIRLEAEEQPGTASDAAALAYAGRGALPLAWKCYKLLLTTPISVAKDERTFSVLKYVKNFYRSTMGATG